MSKLEVTRAALLVVLGVAFVAFDLFVVYATLERLASDLFRQMVVLQGELAVALCGAILWPHRPLRRLLLCGFVIALVWVALARIIGDFFLFDPPLGEMLTVSLVMVLSFCLPCAGCFEIYRRFSNRRLVLLRTRQPAATRPQFGIRHLMVLTVCVAVVALAGRALVSNSAGGQWSVSAFSFSEVGMLSLLFLFPGLASGPIALAVLRPTWRVVWVFPWILLLGIAEMVVVDWLDPTTLPTQEIDDLLQVAGAIAVGYLELGVAVAAIFALLRLGGIRLEQQSAPTDSTA